MVVISDKHHGNIGGLTPPGWDAVTPVENPAHLAEFHRMRRAIWDWFAERVAELGRVDIVIDNGDLIDGKGKRSGGTEILWPDRQDQVDMAVDFHRSVFPGAERFLSFGTPYHTGEEEDWERQVAKDLGCQIGSEDTVNVRGLLVNFKWRWPPEK
jgi:hypothetical protein